LLLTVRHISRQILENLNSMKRLLSISEISDITKQSIPEDFARDAKVHYCWEIKRRLCSR
jgi:23S rRNA G2069 N7-methylase RlmK/C1962 C5-methylase RlmI